MLSERALLHFEEEFVVSKYLEDLLQMLGMFLERGAIHHDVVQVHDHKAVKEWLEYLVHECAKCGGCISEAK